MIELEPRENLWTKEEIVAKSTQTADGLQSFDSSELQRAVDDLRFIHIAPVPRESTRALADILLNKAIVVQSWRYRRNGSRSTHGHRQPALHVSSGANVPTGLFQIVRR